MSITLEEYIISRMKDITNKEFTLSDYNIFNSTIDKLDKNVKFIKDDELNKKGLHVFRFLKNSYNFYQHARFNKDPLLLEFKKNGYLAIQEVLPKHCFDNILKKKLIKINISEPRIVNIINGICNVKKSSYLFKIERLKYTDRYDAQKNLHTDKPRPTIKCWLYLHDTNENHGAFQYVPGSHRPNNKLLNYYYKISNKNINDPNLTEHVGNKYDIKNKPIDNLLGSIRIHNDDNIKENSIIKELGYNPPISLNYPKNTLIIADTLGLHKRGNLKSGYERTTLSCSYLTAKIMTIY